MSNKIIKITEENLRKAVATGDLKQLAPEVFKKKKKVKVQIKVDGWGWEMNNEHSIIFPSSRSLAKDVNGVIEKWEDLLNKPPMLMTLEWEE